VARAALLCSCLGLLLAYAPSASAAGPCSPRLQTGVLPVWARTGFSDPKPRIAHVPGAHGRIVAILFGYPLHSPPARDRNNKILWAARLATNPGSDLVIRAQRMAGSRAVGAAVARRVQGGPGPSIVDLPSAGCWRLTLRWSGRIDTLDLAYVR
jgi:hypothetical protein